MAMTVKRARKSVLNQIDPTGKFAWHGRFCGPEHGDLDRDKPLSRSEDGGLDQCCYEHDKCYRDKGIKPPYPSPVCTQDQDQMDCNRNLCNCLGKTAPPAKYYQKKWGMQKEFGCFNDTTTLFQWNF